MQTFVLRLLTKLVILTMLGFLALFMLPSMGWVRMHYYVPVCCKQEHVKSRNGLNRDFLMYDNINEHSCLIEASSYSIKLDI